jgi:hypothetical protein
MPSQRGNVIRPKGGVAREELCVVLCARQGEGVSADDGFAIRDLLNGVESNGWWFLNPGTFIAVFMSRYSGAEHAAECRESLERLVASRASLNDLEIGTAEGAVLGIFTDAGILETLPMGDVVSEAVKKAMHAS